MLPHHSTTNSGIQAISNTSRAGRFRRIHPLGSLLRAPVGIVPTRSLQLRGAQRILDARGLWQNGAHHRHGRLHAARQRAARLSPVNPQQRPLEGKKKSQIVLAPLRGLRKGE